MSNDEDDDGVRSNIAEGGGLSVSAGVGSHAGGLNSDGEESEQRDQDLVNTVQPEEPALTSQPCSGTPLDQTTTQMFPHSQELPSQSFPPRQHSTMSVPLTQTPKPQRARMRNHYYFPPLPEGTCEDINRNYKLDQKIGEGTYGTVFQARHRTTGSQHAIKEMKLDKNQEGFPLTTVREITIAKRVTNQNLARMNEIMVLEDKKTHTITVALVFEYVDHDLSGILLSGHRLRGANILSLFYQILRGLLCLHKHGIIHRDLKSSNVLVSKEGIAKVCDFGLSRKHTTGDAVTPGLVTQWYRPLEILLDAEMYCSKIDVWSAGCLFGEMFIGFPMFKAGNGAGEQIARITRWCGTPNESNWPGVSRLGGYRSLTKHMPRKIRGSAGNTFVSTVDQKRSSEKLESMGDLAAVLLDKMLTLDPEKRPEIQECMCDNYFFPSVPKGGRDDARNPIALNLGQTCHEWEVKQRQKNHRQSHHRQQQQQGNVAAVVEHGRARITRETVPFPAGKKGSSGKDKGGKGGGGGGGKSGADMKGKGDKYGPTLSIFFKNTKLDPTTLASLQLIYSLYGFFYVSPISLLQTWWCKADVVRT